MSWNRKEVATLLMTGAGFISAIQTAIFSKWVDAKLQLLSAPASSLPGITGALHVIASVGFVSTLVLSTAWVGSRILMARSLTPGDRLDWRVSALVVCVYAGITIGWLLALLT